MLRMVQEGDQWGCPVRAPRQRPGLIESGRGGGSGSCWAVAEEWGRAYLGGMTDRDAFLDWIRSTLRDAEVALHNGDADPRRAIWSRSEPLSILGAWRNAYGQQEVEEAFQFLEQSFSDCTWYEFELQAFDVMGDAAYTAGLEHVSASVDGKPRTFTLRSTQVYRREGGEWKVAHRHADTVTEQGTPEGR